MKSVAVGGGQELTSVQKTHWHCVIVVICSSGNSPRHSLQETKGSTASSHVGRYRAVVIFTTTELQRHRGTLAWTDVPHVSLTICKNKTQTGGLVVISYWKVVHRFKEIQKYVLAVKLG